MGRVLNERKCLFGDKDMRRATILMLIACLFYSASGLAQVQGKPPSGVTQATRTQASADPVNDPRWLRERLEKVRRRYDLPDLGAAIVVNDKVVAASAVGVRKYGTNTPVTQDDPFHLGSITKVMTATLIGMMVEDGVLRWNMKMENMFPELARSMQPAYRTVTVLQLLSHTGGFPFSPSMPMDQITAQRQERRRTAERLRQGGDCRPAPGCTGYQGHLQRRPRGGYRLYRAKNEEDV